VRFMRDAHRSKPALRGCPPKFHRYVLQALARVLQQTPTPTQAGRLLLHQRLQRKPHAHYTDLRSV
jgi:hypothetical protein